MKTVTPDITIYRSGLKCRGIVAAIILTMTASVPAAVAAAETDEFATVRYCSNFANAITSSGIDKPLQVFELADVQSAITKAEECMKLIETINNLRAKIPEKE